MLDLSLIQLDFPARGWRAGCLKNDSTPIGKQEHDKYYFHDGSRILEEVDLILLPFSRLFCFSNAFIIRSQLLIHHITPEKTLIRHILINKTFNSLSFAFLEI